MGMQLPAAHKMTTKNPRFDQQLARAFACNCTWFSTTQTRCAALVISFYFPCQKNACIWFSSAFFFLLARNKVISQRLHHVHQTTNKKRCIYFLRCRFCVVLMYIGSLHFRRLSCVVCCVCLWFCAPFLGWTQTVFFAHLLLFVVVPIRTCYRI